MFQLAPQRGRRYLDTHGRENCSKGMATCGAFKLPHTMPVRLRRRWPRKATYTALLSTQPTPVNQTHMPVSISIEPAAWTFEAAGDIPLLAAAQSAGIMLPSSCRNGTCRTCMCRMRHGQVRYAIEWPGLSADEKRDGYILPCIAYPASDIVLDAPAARRTHAPPE
jgi:ferredoxin